MNTKDANTPPVETIGYCQGCGRLDHHLIHEICPLCAQAVIEFDATLPDELAECSCNDGYPALVKQAQGHA